MLLIIWVEVDTSTRFPLCLVGYWGQFNQKSSFHGIWICTPASNWWLSSIIVICLVSIHNIVPVYEDEGKREYTGGFKRYGGSVDWLLDWPHSNDALNVAGYALWHDVPQGLVKLMPSVYAMPSSMEASLWKLLCSVCCGFSPYWFSVWSLHLQFQYALGWTLTPLQLSEFLCVTV